MPVSVDLDDTRFLIRLNGEAGIADAAELKRSLVQGLASGLNVHLDLEQAAGLEVSSMQLLHAAHAGVSMRLSEAARIALCEAGFAPLTEGAGWSG